MKDEAVQRDVSKTFNKPTRKKLNISQHREHGGSFFSEQKCKKYKAKCQIQTFYKLQ